MNKLHAVVRAHGAGLVLAIAAAALGGCAARVYSEPAYVGPSPSPYDDTEIAYDVAPPVDIETYPSFTFGGGVAYYVDGRWYQRGPRGWGYYRREPQELSRHRGEAEQRQQQRRRGVAQPQGGQGRERGGERPRDEGRRPGPPRDDGRDHDHK
ncbi:MAG TPA: hypothetical protein VIF15_14075 [Polyangiaceae bacterium]|jgi:hypothetical protein